MFTDVHFFQDSNHSSKVTSMYVQINPVTETISPGVVTSIMFITNVEVESNLNVNFVIRNLAKREV